MSLPDDPESGHAATSAEALRAEVLDEVIEQPIVCSGSTRKCRQSRARWLMVRRLSERRRHCSAASGWALSEPGTNDRLRQAAVGLPRAPRWGDEGAARACGRARRRPRGWASRCSPWASHSVCLPRHSGCRSVGCTPGGAAFSQRSDHRAALRPASPASSLVVVSATPPPSARGSMTTTTAARPWLRSYPPREIA